MSQLTTIAFLSKWQSIFADNTTRQIDEGDLRDFRQDIADSFLCIADQNSFFIRGDFAPSGGMPTSSVKKYQVFIATDFANINGVDVAPGTWCIAKIDSATNLADANPGFFNDWWLK